MKILKTLLSIPLLIMIGVYKYIISPLTLPSCRHTPSCSQYASEAIREWGALKGSWFSIKRILKCHPWGSSGYDPVKRKKSIK
jgi:putative membrane protein insertion efficiency factor